MAARKLVRLSPITMAGIRARMALVEQKRLELAVLMDGLNKYIEIGTGVNLSSEDWTLNLDHALLERQQTRKQNHGEQRNDVSGGQAHQPHAEEHGVHESDDGVSEPAHVGPDESGTPHRRGKRR